MSHARQRKLENKHIRGILKISFTEFERALFFERELFHAGVTHCLPQYPPYTAINILVDAVDINKGIFS